MTTEPGGVKSSRIEGIALGRRADKHITKAKVRRHERDRDHDLARAYNAGDTRALDSR